LDAKAERQFRHGRARAEQRGRSQAPAARRV